MKRLFILILGLLTAISASAAKKTILDNRLVELIVTYQTHNEILPWQANNPKTRSGYGIIYDRDHIITTEALVRNHRIVELRKVRTGEKTPVVVKTSDLEVNLAVLTIDSRQQMSSEPPLELCAHVPLDSDVEIIQFDQTRQLQRGEASTLEIGMAPLPDAPYDSLTFSLLSGIDINGDGVGVVYKDKLAGIIISYKRSSRTASMIPSSTIAQFLARIEKIPYPGFARAGFKWQSLLDPAKRKYLNVTEPKTGILVLSCLPGTGAYETLQTEDVIIEWDGHRVDNLGFYMDPEYGRINISHLIKDKRKPGETVPIKVIRDGKTIDTALKLCHRKDSDFLVPENVTNHKPEYIIEGGLIIRELTGSYLRAFGSRWQQKVNARLVNRYFTQKQTPDIPDERIVILAGSLPDPINIGYQQFHNLIITNINNNPVNNIGDVFDILGKENHITRISTQTLGIDIVLDEQELDNANRRIAGNYRIPELQHQEHP